MICALVVIGVGYGGGRRVVKRGLVESGVMLVSKRDVLGQTFCKIPSLAGSRKLRAGTICKFLGVVFGVLSRRGPRCLAIAFSIRTPAFHRRVFTSCGNAEGPVTRRLHRRIPIVGSILHTVRVRIVRGTKLRTSSLLKALSRHYRRGKVSISVVSKSHSALRLTARRVGVHVPGAGRKGARMRSCCTTSIRRHCKMAPGRFVSMGTLVNSATSGVPNIPKINRGATAGVVRRCRAVRGTCRRISRLGPPETDGGLGRF